MPEGVKTTVYFPAGVWARAQAARVETGWSLSRLVARGLEATLPDPGSAQSGAAHGPSPSSERAPGPVRQKAASSAASTRGPVFNARSAAMDRQRKLNEAKSK